MRFLLKIAGTFLIGFSLVPMAVSVEYFRSRSDLGLSPVPAGSPGWCEAGSRERCSGSTSASSSMRYPTSSPRLATCTGLRTQPRALCTRAPTSPAPRNTHFVGNVS